MLEIIFATRISRACKELNRYYLGVDWADEFQKVWVSDGEGKKVADMKVAESVEGRSDFGRWLNERKAEGIELWAAIEKPHGRIVDFLLDPGVVVYPMNPKALDRARDRFRMSQSKSDPFDAYGLSEFLRTDHPHLRVLQPNSEQAHELKILTRDHHQLGRQKTRLLHQITVTLKEYYPRPLEVFSDLETKIALDFLEQYPTPRALSDLNRRRWNRFSKRDHHLSEQHCKELWEKLRQPQMAMPEHVVRAKARLLVVLVAQLKTLLPAVKSYEEKIEYFFASLPAAKLTKALPGGKSGTTLPILWAELGDAKKRWQSWRPLQAEAGVLPVTKEKSRSVQFRYACNKVLRYAAYWFSFNFAQSL